MEFLLKVHINYVDLETRSGPHGCGLYERGKGEALGRTPLDTFQEGKWEEITSEWVTNIGTFCKLEGEQESRGILKLGFERAWS